MMDRETVQNMQSFISKIKFEKLVHLVGFIIRKFITMHGHMNVKLKNTNFAFRVRKAKRGAPMFEKKLIIFQRPVISEMYANEGSNLILDRSNIFSFSEGSRLALRSTESPMPWISETLSAGVEGWFRQNDRSPPSSAQVSNEWRHTSHPLICLHNLEPYLHTWRYFSFILSRIS
jgi:hypothetical protein